MFYWHCKRRKDSHSNGAVTELLVQNSKTHSARIISPLKFPVPTRKLGSNLFQLITIKGSLDPDPGEIQPQE
jgi:hypothetical protein